MQEMKKKNQIANVLHNFFIFVSRKGLFLLKDLMDIKLTSSKPVNSSKDDDAKKENGSVNEK